MLILIIITLATITSSPSSVPESAILLVQRRNGKGGKRYEQNVGGRNTQKPTHVLSNYRVVVPDKALILLRKYLIEFQIAGERGLW